MCWQCTQRYNRFTLVNVHSDQLLSSDKAATDYLKPIYMLIVNGFYKFWEYLFPYKSDKDYTFISIFVKYIYLSLMKYFKYIYFTYI